MFCICIRFSFLPCILYLLFLYYLLLHHIVLLLYVLLMMCLMYVFLSNVTGLLHCVSRFSVVYANVILSFFLYRIFHLLDVEWYSHVMVRTISWKMYMEKYRINRGVFLWILRDFWEDLVLQNTASGCFYIFHLALDWVYMELGLNLFLSKGFLFLVAKLTDFYQFFNYFFH